MKFCKEVEKRLDGAKENVLGQMQTVDEVVTTIDSIKEETRQIRLKLNKAVTEQKEARKLEILNAANSALQKHLCDLENALEREAGGLRVPVSYQIKCDFAGAMKGKRTISSLQGACDDLMAQAKIEANELASVIRGNLTYLKENAFDYKFLFSDFDCICTKPADDFMAVVKSRIADHKEAEQKRLDAEREKIRQEEEAKARQAADAEMAKAEQARREQYDEGQKAVQPKPEPVSQAAPSKQPRTPSANEIIAVLCQHYGANQQTVIGWLRQIEVQEAA